MKGAMIYTMTTGFEQHYLSLRQKEGRLYSDEELLYLPDISERHPHKAEWKLRKESFTRLRKYFKTRPGSLNILEVGCGNGWLAHRLASIQGYEVTGTDVNLSELQQAKKVFNHYPNLQFIQGSIASQEIKDVDYDFIIFAASIQYFSSLKGIISQAFQKLKANGEIHILDSPFYLPGEMDAAKKRTANYYTDIGHTGMTEKYFHHTREELYPFHYKVLYQPSFINHRIFRNKNPFPWLCIKKQA